MFSSFVQNIAQPARPASPAQGSQSTGQLAESAMSNLRKSLSQQRPGSPVKSPQHPKSPPPRAKSTLEDRLRARFVVGESSTETTPAASSRVSPAPPEPISTSAHPLSPSSVPLPESPIASPIQLFEPPESFAVDEAKEVVPPEASELAPVPPREEDEIVLPPADASQSTDVETLQERLRLVEQRFSDVSTSFKRLRAEKAAADAVLRQLTPIETISDAQALRDYVHNALLKAEISTGEIARLTGKLETQEGRIEELRDTHRLESSSQSTQIDQLRKQLAEAEALVTASQGSAAQSTENAAAQKADIERLHGEIEQTKRAAKEEEEKRVKAISLLKTVRQKLVKAEKDRDDAQREAAAFKEKEKADSGALQAEKLKLQAEIETVNAERERALTGLKAQFDREIVTMRERQEKEMSALRGQFELEALTTKSVHTKDIATMTSRVSSLETTVTSLTNDKNALFDELQLRQAKVESAQSRLESLQGQITELQYQLRESEERYALLNEDISETRREQDIRSREPSNSVEDIAELLAANSAKYEVKLADVRKNLSVAEKERNESEAQWSRKLREKVRENEELKQALGSTARSRQVDEGVVEELKTEISRLREQVQLHQGQVSELKAQSASLADVEDLPSQCIALLAEANAMRAHSSLSPDVRQALEVFTLSLGLFVGDEAKASKTSEPHLMHNLQFALGKSDALSGSSHNDTVSFSLTLNYLVTHRAEDFGAGSGTDPAKLLTSMFRNSWVPPVFYTQLLLSAFICLSETTTVTPLVWRSFIVSRLPSILSSFEKSVHVEGGPPENWKGALQVAVTSLSRRAELLERCDRIINHSAHSLPDATVARTVFRDLIRQLLLNGLLDHAAVLAVDPGFSNDVVMHSEHQFDPHDPEPFFARLSPDMDFEDARPFIDRIWNDPQMHRSFAENVLKLRERLTQKPSASCRGIFYLFDVTLDIFSLHHKVSELIFHALLYLQDFDCDTVGDPQTAVSHLGDVVLFVQCTIARFHLQGDVFSFGGRKVSSHFIRSTSAVHDVGELKGEDQVAFTAWYKALFDRNSEGIEDTILRSVKPKTLLRISATLFSHAMRDHNIDDDVLSNGISYFTGPLLSWTLVGVIVNTIHEIQARGYIAGSQPVLPSVPQILDYPRRTIREAIGKARASKAPNLDIDRCVKICGAARFLKTLWSELTAPNNLGDTDVSTRIATFALTIPRPAVSGSLLPVFLNTVLPQLIMSIDAQKVGDQTVPGELLSAIVASLLTSSLHLDLAFKGVEVTRPVLGQSSLVSARRLAGDLRGQATRGSNISKMILHKLGASPAIVTNFPMFKA
ncbi:Mediator of RNA polymerase II transcription subunit 5 [Mycena kentingensis (nom. inval.)]|nr:Mediator of RNA polymerase II transcription subunit 5 [Mycena kentingensis (nom. inval.)]